jgi:hypothetical protein
MHARKSRSLLSKGEREGNEKGGGKKSKGARQDHFSLNFSGIETARPTIGREK